MTTQVRLGLSLLTLCHSICSYADCAKHSLQAFPFCPGASQPAMLDPAI